MIFRAFLHTVLFPLEVNWVLILFSQASITEQQDRCNSLALELQRKSEHVEDRAALSFAFSPYLFFGGSEDSKYVTLVTALTHHEFQIADRSCNSHDFDALSCPWQVLEQHIRQVRCRPAVASGKNRIV